MTSPLVLIRADSSLILGAGHVMRCLTLAEAIRQWGGRVLFVCRENVGDASRWLTRNHFKILGLPAHPESPSRESAQEFLNLVKSLDQIPDWLIIDHYGIDRQWENSVRNYVKKIMVIDDLANRPHDCDLLLDPTAGRKPEDYSSLISPHCRSLLGSSYALLRNQFAKIRPSALKNRRQSPKIKRILIGFGGTDNKNIAGLTLEALSHRQEDIDVLIGSSSPHLPALKAHVSHQNRSNIHLHIDTDDVAPLMAHADIALGAGGGTAWERCCMGLPSLLIQSADNQEFLVRSLAQAGGALFIGESENLSVEKLADEISRLADNPILREQLSKKSALLCDGLGAGRTLCELFPLAAKDGRRVGLRQVAEEDMQSLYDWQSHADTRRYSFRTKVPTWEEHQVWFRNRFNDPLNPFHVILHDNIPAGIVRLDYKKMRGSFPLYEISIYVAPEKYNQGIGRAALKLIRMTVPKSIFFARVLKQNTTSVHLFESSGYQRKSDGYYQRPI
ncbi:MAG: UDP-2,4-diacetamido-2,4,6-trideoxy-beta-L-altropyranose hydrolase [Nitrospinae bacterium CG11_big_fil_rev_8_21_14_0_20_45_15]|nr:MAG: UDP-2,4-diacetamido-2,4,6-trideoxy-beta-L-altropyranose hydrolase [Nitrospinae bacterium CG11_big_fil_rev_8_21_14_0_20_45_15]